MNPIVALSIVGALASTTYVLNDHENRIRSLENAGEVSVTLEKVPEPKVIEVKEYDGPQLYKDKFKIVFSDKKEFDCLSRNIYYESRGETLIGKISVAQTVLNRAETGKWGYSFCSVIYAPHQYSWTSNKKLKEPHGPSWESSKNAARLFVNGTRVKNLENVKHYHAIYVSPYWKNSMIQTAIVGNHIFYASK